MRRAEEFGSNTYGILTIKNFPDVCTKAFRRERGSSVDRLHNRPYISSATLWKPGTSFDLGT